MEKSLLLVALCFTLAASSAEAWKVKAKSDFPDETVYVVECDGGDTAKVKQMHPVAPNRQYENGWWHVVDGNYFGYPSIEAAVKVACKYPAEKRPG